MLLMQKTRSEDLQKLNREMKELKKKEDAIKREVEGLERYDEVVPTPGSLEQGYSRNC